MRRILTIVFLVFVLVSCNENTFKENGYSVPEADDIISVENEISNKEAGVEENNIYFYVTPHGEKYHYSDCSYIRRDLSECRMYTEVQAEKRGYEPCSRCIG